MKLVLLNTLLATLALGAEPTLRTLELNLGETQSVELADGSHAKVKLVALHERRDTFRDAVREARVTVEVNGTSLVLTSANYNLPVTVAGVQIDCPITHGCVAASSKANVWALDKDARFRLWPAGAPWIEPGTFGEETWNFGDDTPPVKVKSDGNVKEHAPDGYAITQHAFANPGHYLVRVERTNEQGEPAIAHLHVEVTP